jgi:hypothetical protein
MPETTTYHDGQIIVEDGLTIKISVQYDTDTDADDRTVTLIRTISKFKQSGNGWRYDPFFVDRQELFTASGGEIPTIIERLVWGKAIQAEETARERAFDDCARTHCH